ncbi:type I-C CRISPR-associated protein Cas5c [Ruminococcus sp.]|uniref:type I-C CRISPR-associated protein Cas5c n=1 Tax=Ruminococcus sp. TaxID=41978 RepID=UPI0025E80B52|nr:type I-C CRISPR-associated protein Cas5c [Ruminococcus sp.]MBQ9543284.1 type I-C CRISPR-associated protein Cas5 [Ruminococcus sp.]
MKKHRNTVEFCVHGKYALFSDVLTRVGGEKCSYTIPTYEALKGILQSVYFKPTITWFIDEVRIMNPIKTVRKGIRTKLYSPEKTKVSDLYYYTYLEDVCYQVRAHFEWNMNRPELEQDRNEHKHHNIAKRMIERGGRRDIFLGTRECQGYVEPCVFGEGEGAYDKVDMDMAFMYYGIIYPDEAEKDEDKGYMTVCLWQPKMKDGIIEFVRPSEIAPEHKRHIKKMEMKKFGKELDNFTGLDEFKGGEFDELDE